MPKITEQRDYNGVLARIERLGLTPLVEQLKGILTDFSLLVKEEKDSNGGAAVRKLIDGRFEDAGGWKITKAGDVDWIKCHVVNGTSVCLGVEIQFSARSDLLVMDICHLRDALTDGVIDIGILVVPDDTLARYLTDRGPRFSDAVRHVRAARAEDFPLLLLGLRHDGRGEPLAKQFKAPQKRS
ncbi:MAG TPA: hypothetical protein VFP80_15865 [Thermoanaerobaculia bacterium]|nr:hypothetical protein [Thermoanaerobaculia bacterium]